MASKYDVNTKETTAFCEYSVLVVGFTGVGKSAFCNFLTDTKLFNEFEGIFGESSNEINKQQCEVLGTKLTIIDCPGFGDTEKTIEEYSTELENYLTQHLIFIEIIILVINLTKRFSKEESELFLKMSKTMGHFWEKTFCVFTHAASLEKNFKAKQTHCSVETKFDYIELIKNSSKTSQELKELLNIVQDRYICIETVDKAGDDEYWTANVAKLLESFREIRKNRVELEKKMKKMEPREGIPCDKGIKKEMDLINPPTIASLVDQNAVIAALVDQNAVIASLVDQNTELREMVKLQANQLSQLTKIKESPNKQLKEIGQNKKPIINCNYF